MWESQPEGFKGDIRHLSCVLKGSKNVLFMLWLCCTIWKRSNVQMKLSGSGNAIPGDILLIPKRGAAAASWLLLHTAFSISSKYDKVFRYRMIFTIVNWAFSCE